MRKFASCQWAVIAYIERGQGPAALFFACACHSWLLVAAGPGPAIGEHLALPCSRLPGPTAIYEAPEGAESDGRGSKSRCLAAFLDLPWREK